MEGYKHIRSKANKNRLELMIDLRLKSKGTIIILFVCAFPSFHL